MRSGQATNSFPETALYPPIKAFLEAQGFTVRAEVHGCDVVAVRQHPDLAETPTSARVRPGGRRSTPTEEVVVVELKRQFNLDLVFQGIDRQRSCETVYVAVPAPAGRRQAGRWRDVRRLCQRLGLGLIAVRFDPNGPAEEAGARASIEVALDPGGAAIRRGGRERSRLIREVGGRSGDHNVGGTTRQPLVTAYRELVLRMARALALVGEASPKALYEALSRELAAFPASPKDPASAGALREDGSVAVEVAKIGAILRRDHYGWFVRFARGIYRLTPDGEAALVEYARVLDGSGPTNATVDLAGEPDGELTDR